ncbi:exo-alpha-sialidase [Flavobacteriaceae bacterium LMO-SS05]
MAKQIGLLIFISLGYFLFNSCESKPKETITLIPTPASEKSSEPNLHKGKDGTIYLSWIEVLPDKSSVLKFSTMTHNRLWSEPKTIAKGTDWFVNWADFPAMTSFGDHDLASHYLEKSANGTYTYDIKLTFSKDDGDSWSKPIIPHTDGTNSEHGFVSKLAMNDDTLLSIWLDGRQYAYAEENDSITKEMTLRAALFDADGKRIKDYLIDERVCDCCQTDAAMTENGPIVVYRNRSNDEVRDIYYSRLIDNQWSEPKPINNDNWNIAGCPVNGPAIATKDHTVAVVWYTLEKEVPTVKLAFSNNNGETFDAPLILGKTSPLGRVDLELLDEHTALVTWMDMIEGNTDIQMQRIDITGARSNLLTLAKTSDDRSSGFPKIVVKDDIAYLAYTLSGKNLSIKTLAVRVEALELNN